MILTVTINPLLERRYYFQSIELSSVNRNGKLIIQAGGKGINVNRQLNRFGIKNIAMLFTGGTNGKLFREALRKEQINFSEIITKNETRDSAIIIDRSAEKVYSFFGTDAIVSSNEVREFISKLEKAIAACEIVVFSGSSPCKEADSIFVEGIKIANKLDKISVCDTYGGLLQNCFDSSPTIVHNNVDEIRTSLGLSLEKENDHLKFLNMLYEKGVKQAYITDSGNQFYASNFDFHYKVTPPEIKAADSTGSGDAFVAGIVYGWHNKYPFEQQLRFATTLGVLNAKSTEVCDVEIADVDPLSEKIHIEPVGKRLKEIDDSPD
ncbi:MAG: 1-phosphofructokinase [Ignavibacteriaceae bacterium]|nr:1-phosphofructokinase [Ignavibacteriaceae bacterium]